MGDQRTPRGPNFFALRESQAGCLGDRSRDLALHETILGNSIGPSDMGECRTRSSRVITLCAEEQPAGTSATHPSPSGEPNDRGKRKSRSTQAAVASLRACTHGEPWHPNELRRRSSIVRDQSPTRTVSPRKSLRLASMTSDASKWAAHDTGSGYFSTSEFRPFSRR